MSLLMDALKKADKAIDTKQKTIQVDKKLDKGETGKEIDEVMHAKQETAQLNLNSQSPLDKISEGNEEWLFTDETEDDDAQKITSLNNDSSSNLSATDWNEELLPTFQEVDSQVKTSTSHFNQTHDTRDLSIVDLNGEEPFSSLQEDKAKNGVTSANWEEDILPQFQLDESNAENLSLTEIKPLSEDLKNEVKPFDGSFSEFKLLDENLSEVESLATETPIDFTIVSDEKLQPEFEADSTVPKTAEEDSPSEIVAEESHRPEDAKRVLAANTPPTSTRILWLSGMLGVLVLSMGIVYYYYSYSSSTESLSFKPKQRLQSTDSTQPLVATSMNAKQPSSILQQPVSHSLPVAPPKLVNENNQPVAKADEPANIQRITPSSTATKMSNSEKTPTVLSSSKTIPSENHSDDSQKIKSTTKSLAQQKIETLTQTLSPPKKVPGIHTLRKRVISRINPELTKGYLAFQRGDDKTAQRAYTKVLRKDKNNRNALLGLAALALHRGNIQQAQQYYRQILQLNPQDAHAQAGLINTLNKHSLSSESQLKLLLEQTPQSAYIHFSLGNLYANQARWTQAQQAYFDAYRYDNTQADYAYNLAVSLDHLNKPRLALNYYQRALQMMDNQQVNFNRQAAQKRVQTLLTRTQTQTSALANLPTDTF